MASVTGRAVAGRTVLVAGATSAMGIAAAGALMAAGARVIAVGRDDARLAPLATMGARTEVADLTDEAQVGALAGRLRHGDVSVDAVLHLVGGWRGGGGLAGQSEEDYRFLEGSFTSLRHVSRAFIADLTASPAGRLAIISSTAVARPLAGGANYAAVKAASEAWTRAVAQGFAKDARDRDAALSSAAVIFRVGALAGLEEDMAARFVGLWEADAPANGAIVEVPRADR